MPSWPRCRLGIGMHCASQCKSKRASHAHETRVTRIACLLQILHEVQGDATWCHQNLQKFAKAASHNILHSLSQQRTDSNLKVPSMCWAQGTMIQVKHWYVWSSLERWRTCVQAESEKQKQQVWQVWQAPCCFYSHPPEIPEQTLQFKHCPAQSAISATTLLPMLQKNNEMRLSRQVYFRTEQRLAVRSDWFL